MARLLHRRHQAESERLDVVATVQASIAALGFPTLRFRKDSRLPEYLFLIDRASLRDHQAHLYEHLAGMLREQGLFVGLYFYEGDPRVCWTGAGDESVALEQIQKSHVNHRLLLFGEGGGLLDPISGRLAGWHRMFTSWSDRAVLTPKPASQWAAAEVHLASQFAVVPATLKGLGSLAAWFELHSAVELRSSEQSSSIPGPGREPTMDALRRFLGGDVFQWLCVCAVYPELQWDLTLHLGTLPSMPEALVSEDNLVKLLSLEWFRNGSMPDELRRELIAQLDPAVLAEAREAIVGLLGQSPVLEGRSPPMLVDSRSHTSAIGRSA